MLKHPTSSSTAQAATAVPTNFASTSWQAQDLFAQTSAFDLFQPSAQVPQYQANFQPPPITLFQQMSQTSADSYDTSATETLQSTATDTMEIPYAEEFAWPFEMASTCQSNAEGCLMAPMDLESSQIAVTSEDIAAFMRIHPAAHPFG